MQILLRVIPGKQFGHWNQFAEIIASYWTVDGRAVDHNPMDFQDGNFNWKRVKTANILKYGQLGLLSSGRMLEILAEKATLSENCDTCKNNIKNRI